LTVSKLCILGIPPHDDDEAMNVFKDYEARNGRRYLVVADFISGSVGPDIYMR
jgi:hypothetical protein